MVEAYSIAGVVGTWTVTFVGWIIFRLLRHGAIHLGWVDRPTTQSEPTTVKLHHSDRQLLSQLAADVAAMREKGESGVLVYQRVSIPLVRPAAAEHPVDG
jgi:hypothetical protein